VEAPAAREAVTAVLSAAGREGRDVFHELLPLVYDELRQMARRQLARERRQRTLSTTGLVHEAYLKLVDQAQATLKDRAYFFAAAARAMRQVLVDAARRRNRIKRGSGETPLDLRDSRIAVDDFAAELRDLDDALTRLATLFPRQARVVECRFFGGLSVEETAEALELAPRTVKRDWSLARAWLFRELRGARP
jgi:RNA polymerase sigma factor (TIGR02999 family)